MADFGGFKPRLKFFKFHLWSYKLMLFIWETFPQRLCVCSTFLTIHAWHYLVVLIKQTHELISTQVEIYSIVFYANVWQYWIVRNPSKLNFSNISSYSTSKFKQRDSKVWWFIIELYNFIYILQKLLISLIYCLI